MHAAQCWNLSQGPDARGLQHALAMSSQVSLRMTDVANAPDPAAAFESALARVAETASRQSVNASTITVGVDAGNLCPATAWELRCAILGPGPLVFFLNDAFMDPLAATGRRRYTWQALWSLPAGAGIRIAYANWVTPVSRMLLAEKADAIQLPDYLQVPLGSAWGSATINVSQCIDAGGEILGELLSDVVAVAMEEADRQHDDNHWPTADMRNDSSINRRVAVHLAGIGDLVAAAGRDPRDLATLSLLECLVRRVRHLLQRASAQMAQSRGEIGALASSHGHLTPDWVARWRPAGEIGTVGHRNLLVMSPLDVFPQGSTAGSGYADLLPLLAGAEACVAPEIHRDVGWNFNEFKQFHSRAWAVLEQKTRRSLIAEYP